jgi:hypothetical protein
MHVSRWTCFLLLFGCSERETVPRETGDPGDPACTSDKGELTIAVTVDGFSPADPEGYRALVRRGDEEPIQVPLSSDAVGEISLTEGLYSVSALALDGQAEAAWSDNAPVLACSLTETTVEMVGFGR